MADDLQNGAGGSDDEHGTMRDVSHTPPWGENVTEVWHRGPATVADAPWTDRRPDAGERDDQASD